MKLVLVGPNAGKDVKFGKHEFKAGVLDLPDENSKGAVKVLGAYHSAYPEGSEALKQAQAAWDAAHPASKAPEGEPPAADTNPGKGKGK